VARRRTERQALPVLGEAAVYLAVALVSRARLPDLGLLDGTRLGESPLYGEGDGARAGPPWRVMIWSGVASGGETQER
jgi:hypothetical protein